MKSKIIFYCRDSIQAKYLANSLLRENLLDLIVIESGKKAKVKKIKRYFKNKNILQYPLLFLDIISIYLYNSYYEVKLKKYFRTHVDYPNGVETKYIDDINEPKSINILKSYKNPIVVVLGTGIIKEEFLFQKTKAIYNIHGGLVPKYRNVHSDFWAYYNKDFKNIGTSIIFLDKGIDTGDIAIQKNIELKANDTLLTAKIKNIKLSKELISNILKNNSTKRLKQNINYSKFYKTPGFVEISRLIAKL